MLIVNRRESPIGFEKRVTCDGRREMGDKRQRIWDGRQDIWDRRWKTGDERHMMGDGDMGQKKRDSGIFYSFLFLW